MSTTPPPPPPPPPMSASMPGTSAYSPWISRVGGYLVRGIAVAPIWIGGLLVTSLLANVSEVLGLVVLLVTYVWAITFLVRNLIQRGHLGYDIGDRVVGQDLVRSDTGVPLGSGWTVFGRQLLHVVDAIPLYIGFLWPLWDAKKQTFADKMMSTVVVTGRPQTHTAGELFVNALQIWKPVIKS